LGHSFVIADFQELAERSDIDVIVGHGLETDDARFDRELFQQEMCPVFTAPARTTFGLTTNELFRVLQGQVVDWQQLGQPSGHINVYLHGGDLQKPAFESLLRQNGVDITKVKYASPTYARDYLELERLACNDTNALVIGLRTLTPKGLKPVKLDGISIIGRTAPKDYPLRENIFIYKRKGQATSDQVAEEWKQKVDLNIPPDVKAIMLEQSE
jgi:hypothetical protein